MLNSLQRMLAIHRASKRIQRLSASLYVSILHTLGHILDFFQQRSRTKAFKALLQQNSFGESTVTACIENMRSLNNQLCHESDLCTQERQQYSLRAIKTTQYFVADTHLEMRGVKEAILENTRRNDHNFQILQQQYRVLQNNISHLFLTDPGACEETSLQLQSMKRDWNPSNASS